MSVITDKAVVDIRPVALVAVLIALNACAPDERIVGPATPQRLATRSSDDFGQNEAGLIATSRLERWLGDWSANKPTAVKGELIVLQFDATASGAPWLAKQEGVRTYQAAELTRLMEPRNNGIAAIGTVPSNGIRIDSFMRRFALQPNEDFVLFVTGEATPDSMAVLARAWLAFRYWGWNHANLGLLNGSVSSLPASLRAEAADAHPFTGQTRIDTVNNDHFVLLADLAAVRSAIGVEPIVDVREAAEFEGRALGVTTFDSTCLDTSPCSATFSGRIASSLNVPASTLQHADGTLRSLRELDAATASLDRTRTAYLYDLDGHESAVAAFAFVGVLGQPTRWYAASFIEWGAMNASHPNAGLRALPANSPWRTDDFPALTEGANDWATIEQGIRPLVFDPRASSSDGVQQSDVAYKQNPPALPAVGAGEGGC